MLKWTVTSIGTIVVIGVIVYALAKTGRYKALWTGFSYFCALITRRSPILYENSVSCYPHGHIPLIDFKDWGWVRCSSTSGLPRELLAHVVQTQGRTLDEVASLPTLQKLGKLSLNASKFWIWSWCLCRFLWMPTKLLVLFFDLKYRQRVTICTFSTLYSGSFSCCRYDDAVTVWKVIVLLHVRTFTGDVVKRWFRQTSLWWRWSCDKRTGSRNPTWNFSIFNGSLASGVTLAEVSMTFQECELMNPSFKL